MVMCYLKGVDNYHIPFSSSPSVEVGHEVDEGVDQGCHPLVADYRDGEREPVIPFSHGAVREFC